MSNTNTPDMRAYIDILSEQPVPSQLTLSDQTFYRNETSRAELTSHAAKLIERLTELVTKDEPGFNEFTSDEQSELNRIFADLKAIAFFEDEEGPLINRANVEQIKRTLAQTEANLGFGEPWVAYPLFMEEQGKVVMSSGALNK
jgi:hypothetical protein